MKLNRKIIATSLAVLGVVTLCSCDTKPKNLSIPYGSLTDSLYASAVDGKYSMTEKQLYTKLRSTGYDAFLKKIYSVVFNDEINNVISTYSTDTDVKKEIDDAVASACFSTTSPTTLKTTDTNTIRTNRLTYIDSMLKNGIKVSVDNLSYELVDEDSDGRLDNISFNNLTTELISYYAYDTGLKHAGREYYASIADQEQIYDYGREELVDNSDYIDEEAIRSRYNNSYKDYNSTKAIIIRFNSARDAQDAIEKVEKTKGELTNDNALEFFVELYNTYYSYRKKLTITNGTLDDVFALSYKTDAKNTELTSISSNFKTFYEEALVDGGFSTSSVVDGSYTAFPRAIDDKYFMTFRLSTTYETGQNEAIDFDELENELGLEEANKLKAQLKEELIDAKASSSIATTAVFKNMLFDGDGDHSADDILDIKIYDPYYEYKFYTTYADDDYYSYISKKEFNNNSLASITYNGKTTEITVDDFYQQLSEVSGSQTATTYLLNQYMNDTYSSMWFDSDDLDAFKDQFKALIKSFKNGSTAYPKFLGTETYYTINFGYATEEEIYTQYFYGPQLISKYAATYYRDSYFVANGDSFSINEDIKIFKNLLEYTSRVYQSLFTIDVSHFLISVDDKCDGTIDDPAIFRESLETEEEKTAFDNAVVELSKALISEANFITTNKLSALQYLQKAFNEGKQLVSPGYEGKTWDDFKYTYNFKITVESLGKVTQDTVSSYVKPFASYIEETYKQVAASNLDFDDDDEEKTYFFLNGLTDSDGATDLDKLTMNNLCSTIYGYHVLVVNDFDEPTNAYYSSSSDSSGNYDSIKVVVDEKDEDDDNDDIYFVTNAYNESTTNISINQLYIYFYEYLVEGSVTSLSSNLRNAISAMLSPVITRFTNSSFQTWLQLDELGEITFYDKDSQIYTYQDYIASLETAIDTYEPNEIYDGWFDLEWN